MSIKLEKLLVVSVCLLICAGIVAWSFVWVYGKMEIKTNQPFVLTGIGNEVISCEKDCVVKVPIGEYSVIFSSNGFKSIKANVVVQRLQTTSADLNFEYQPVLIVGEISKNTHPAFIPNELKNFELTWDKYNQKAAFLKNSEEKIELMLWKNEEEKIEKITNFYNLKIEKLIWSNGGKNILVKSNYGFYLIDLTKKLKTSLPKLENAINLAFSPKDNKILGQNPSPFILDLETKEKKIINLSPIEITWKDEDNLIYAVQTEKTTDLYEYNLENKKITFIFSLEMLVVPENLRTSSDKKSVEFEAEEKSYELRLVK